ncbi:MAG: hypothetical protein ACE5F1_02390 [Planctomycetota bacterium]
MPDPSIRHEGCHQYLTLLHMGEKELYAKPRLHYAQSWGLVHSLRRRHRKIFDRLFDSLRAGKAHHEAMEMALAGVDLERLEDRFAVNVARLRKSLRK